jgi:hypothetical protein
LGSLALLNLLQNHQEKNTDGGADSEKKTNQIGVLIPGGESQKNTKQQ